MKTHEDIPITLDSLVYLAVGSGRLEILHGVAKRIASGETLSPAMQTELLVILAERILSPRPTSKAAEKRAQKAEDAVRGVK